MSSKGSSSIHSLKRASSPSSSRIERRSKKAKIELEKKDLFATFPSELVRQVFSHVIGPGGFYQRKATCPNFFALSLVSKAFNHEAYESLEGAMIFGSFAGHYWTQKHASEVLNKVPNATVIKLPYSYTNCCSKNCSSKKEGKRCSWVGIILDVLKERPNRVKALEVCFSGTSFSGLGSHQIKSLKIKYQEKKSELDLSGFSNLEELNLVRSSNVCKIILPPSTRRLEVFDAQYSEGCFLEAISGSNNIEEMILSVEAARKVVAFLPDKRLFFSLFPDIKRLEIPATKAKGYGRHGPKTMHTSACMKMVDDKEVVVGSFTMSMNLFDSEGCVVGETEYVKTWVDPEPSLSNFIPVLERMFELERHVYIYMLGALSPRKTRRVVDWCEGKAGLPLSRAISDETTRLEKIFESVDGFLNAVK